MDNVLVFGEILYLSNQKQKISSKWITLFFCIIIFLSLFAINQITIVSAQQPKTEFFSLDINFWPEYDDQNMFVRYKGVLDPNTQLPVKLQFKLPYNSTLMNYVTIENLSGQKIYLPYEVYQQGAYQVVEFSIDTLQFELTYHDENFKKIADQRFYNIDLLFDYFIYDLNIVFQVPQNSEEMQIQPTPQDEFIGMYNLNYYVVDYKNINAEQAIPIELNYFKNNDQLTLNYAQPILPDYNNTESNYFIYIIIVILVMIILGLIVYLLKVENNENINIRRNLKKN